MLRGVEVVVDAVRGKVAVDALEALLQAIILWRGLGEVEEAMRWRWMSLKGFEARVESAFILFTSRHIQC